MHGKLLGMKSIVTYDAVHVCVPIRCDVRVFVEWFDSLDTMCGLACPSQHGPLLCATACKDVFIPGTGSVAAALAMSRQYMTGRTHTRGANVALQMCQGGPVCTAGVTCQKDVRTPALSSSPP